jgi:NAD(P)-dependent dehydrogenase (short-subunit alcohol dehydrogenase family)
VRALCEVLRQELAPEGLRATLVTPGFAQPASVDIGEILVRPTIQP